jgi:hypothetical protein
MLNLVTTFCLRGSIQHAVCHAKVPHTAWSGTFQPPKACLFTTRQCALLHRRDSGHPHHWCLTRTIRRLPIITSISSRMRPRKAKCITCRLALLCLTQEFSLACTCVLVLALLLVVNLCEPIKILGAILHSLTATLGGTAKLSGGNPGSCMGACRCNRGVHARCFWRMRVGYEAGELQAARVTFFLRKRSQFDFAKANTRGFCDCRVLSFRGL